MIVKTPPWWFGPPDWRADLLQPIGHLYQAITAHRLKKLATAPKAGVPVICVGNLVAGGSGKTPVLKELATLLGTTRQVHAISRGYGGRITGPHRVDPAHDSATDTGDEALELALSMPCWVARNRYQGALAAQQAGAEVILLDDGLQNPGLHKDLSIVVMDANRGIGNGRGIPAGPLREKPSAAWSRIGAVIVTGDTTESDHHGNPDFWHDRWSIPRSTPVFRARPVLTTPCPSPRYIAFAGIGHPEKFFQFLRKNELNICKTLIFPDHHPYTQDQINDLHAMAVAEQAHLVTTRKDIVRLTPTDRQDIEVADIRLCFDQPEALLSFLTPFACIRA